MSARDDLRSARAVERAAKDLERHALLSARIRKTICKPSWDHELKLIEKRRGL